MKKRDVGILVYDDVEVLDFAGPFEVFAVTAELNDSRYFDVSLIAVNDSEYRAVNGLRVLPNRVLKDIDALDVLVIPGGSGSRQLMRDRSLLAWLEKIYGKAEIVMSVCSGIRLLAALDLLKGKEVTTHHQVAPEIQRLVPEASINLDRRFIDHGRMITTGGITAGIDGAFHVVARLLGEMTARRTAQYMEYDWQPDRYYDV